MLAIALIALILGLVSIAVGLVLVFRVSAVYGDMEELAKRAGDYENSVKGIRLWIGDLEKDYDWQMKELKRSVDELGMDDGIVYTNLDGVSYDPNTSTMTVKGNLRAEGWIASGGKRMED